MAALNYIEPTLTEDLDILVSIDAFGERPSGLLTLAPVFEALRQQGYGELKKEGVIVGGWPVQFLPVASALDEEALTQAVEVDLGTGASTVKARVLRAEHVVATAVKLGRLKDWARIDEFLKQNAVDLAILKGVLERHGLMPAWFSFCQRSGVTNPFLAK